MVTVLFIIATLAAAEVDAPAIAAGNDEVRAYLAEGGEGHPRLKALHQRWLAALERVPQVKSLDDPRFTYGQFVQSDVNRMKLMLSQKFPWVGT